MDARARHTVPAVLAALTVASLLAGCGHAGNAHHPAPASSTDLGHLQKLVGDADSAAGTAESDMARE
ncbi:hypothetical protein OG762_02565 [Streptomyces sp. NBC_01136]|uniref:hypothetical protein n=1 Tax=unclassified Streptomyces TaxID=2593676 RepID=UPI003254FC79|nr:hypothetical protein OG762_02565 [Streptomyces sp. NBC_01136]